MCGSIPATGGGSGTALPAIPPSATPPATTPPATMTAPGTTAATTSAPSTAGGGAPGKVVQGGGAADGVNQLQLQQTLSSLVQAIAALTELLKSMPASAVNGASGGGAPDKTPTQVPTQTPPTKVAGGGEAPGKCDIPPPPTFGGGATGAATGNSAPATTHAH